MVIRPGSIIILDLVPTNKKKKSAFSFDCHSSRRNFRIDSYKYLPQATPVAQVP